MDRAVSPETWCVRVRVSRCDRETSNGSYLTNSEKLTTSCWLKPRIRLPCVSSCTEREVGRKFLVTNSEVPKFHIEWTRERGSSFSVGPDETVVTTSETPAEGGEVGDESRVLSHAIFSTDASQANPATAATGTARDRRARDVESSRHPNDDCWSGPDSGTGRGKSGCSGGTAARWVSRTCRGESAGYRHRRQCRRMESPTRKYRGTMWKPRQTSSVCW